MDSNQIPLRAYSNCLRLVGTPTGLVAVDGVPHRPLLFRLYGNLNAPLRIKIFFSKTKIVA